MLILKIVYRRINMRKIILSLGILALAIGCVSTRGGKSTTRLIIGPRAGKWLQTHQIDQKDRLAIVVKSTRPLNKYEFLKLQAENLYSGYATYKQIKRLTLDPYVVRISTAKQKTQVPTAKPQVPVEPVKE